VLAEIELSARLGRRPRMLEVAAGVDPRAAGADAWLRIGDAALREALAADAPPSFNPSAAWTARTGLPFVFACWVGAPQLELRARGELFHAARARGRAATAALAREAARTWRLAERDCADYLERECVYELAAPEMARALRRFRDEAARLGACRADLEPRGVERAAAPDRLRG
jgi:predicted solute-binding protein